MKKVIAYTTSTCPHCINAKKFLKQEGIAFEGRDVNTNPAARDEYAKLNLRGVPAFVIGGEVIEGFNEQRIKSLLDYFVVSCPSCKARMRVPKNKGQIKVSCKTCETQFEVNTNK